MWSDRLSTKEVERTDRAIAELSKVQWAQPLLTRLHRSGGMKPENMPLMFEIRFAQELHHAGVTAQYEFSAGVDGSTIEFRLHTSPAWLIELVSVRTSDSAKRAIHKKGFIYEQTMSPTPEDPGRSEEGEMITAEQKIGEKVFSGGKPTKFPPLDGSLRMILTDIRGYLDEGGDALDYRQMAYGANGIPPKYELVTHYWESQPGRLTPIKGLFEESNPLRAARYIQERIHFLGFVRERDFFDREIGTIGYYLPNWHLFTNEEEARLAYETYPLAQRAS
jgi:hypothetical protein